MILIDFSHLIHRMLYVSISEASPKKQNGKYITEDFKDIFVYLIMQQFIFIRKKYSDYGEIVVCLDNSSKRYWRKNVCPLYKLGREKARSESDINFNEVFEITEDILSSFKEHFPFKIINIDSTEADDIIAVVSRYTSEQQLEKCLIYSEDKDFYQMLKYPNVSFYRPVAKEWVTTEKKDMNEWLLEHVCMGDGADGVPRIVDNIYYSDAFKNHIKNFGLIDVSNKMQFDIQTMDNDELVKNIFDSFTIYKKNRKNESTGELDIYANKQFSMNILNKEIKKHGSLDNFLDSHPYIRKRYELNKILVLEEYIPDEIRDMILSEFKRQSREEKEYNQIKIEEFFMRYKLTKLMPNIPILLRGYKQKSLMSLEDFGW